LLKNFDFTDEELTAISVSYKLSDVSEQDRVLGHQRQLDEMTRI
jgi:hypothetical protein